MILLIDNYDSFTFNLVQYIRELGEHVIVKRNNQISLAEINEMQPTQILLSPGPGNPDAAGICLDIVKTFHPHIPILGVCLGHQIIAQSFGGKVKKALQPMHGKTTMIDHDQRGIFQNLPNPLQVARYHSLIVDEKSLPSCLEISARTMDGEVMSIRHRELQVEGVQFHPEAILTEKGVEMLANFFLPKQKKQKEDSKKDDTTRPALIV
ncbi:MAG: anthranilate synthase component II [Bacillota bacterium]